MKLSVGAVVLGLALASLGCGGRAIHPETASKWLAQNRVPSGINISGRWRAPDWGSGTIIQKGSNFEGSLSGRRTYNVRGTVSGKKVRILFLIGEQIWWTGELAAVSKTELKGHYSASGAILDPNNGAAMSMFREMKLSPKKRERTKVKHARRGKGRKVEPPPVPKSEKVADKAGLIWFYGLNDKRHGPVSQKDLLRLVEAKTLSGESLVWKKGMKDWVELNTVKELAK